MKKKVGLAKVEQGGLCGTAGRQRSMKSAVPGPRSKWTMPTKGDSFSMKSAVCQVVFTVAQSSRVVPPRLEGLWCAGVRSEWKAQVRYKGSPNVKGRAAARFAAQIYMYIYIYAISTHRRPSPTLAAVHLRTPKGKSAENGGKRVRNKEDSEDVTCLLVASS